MFLGRVLGFCVFGFSVFGFCVFGFFLLREALVPSLLICTSGWGGGGLVGQVTGSVGGGPAVHLRISLLTWIQHSKLTYTRGIPSN